MNRSSRKARDVNPVEGKKTANLTKDEHSAILIQRAWRQHRNRGLELRKQQRAQDMHERAEAREQEVIYQNGWNCRMDDPIRFAYHALNG